MKITMKKSQVKTMFLLLLLFTLITGLIYGVTTTLLTADNINDNDGYLDLRGSCTPTPNVSSSASVANIEFNITNATFYSNVDGTWKANKTYVAVGSVPNATFFFNHTLNVSAEGEFQWNLFCGEENTTPTTTGGEGNEVFAGNRTIQVNYAKPVVTADSPFDGVYDLDGNNLNVTCTGRSEGLDWNLTQVDLFVSFNGTTGPYLINQTHTLITAQDEGIPVVTNFSINAFPNASIADGSDVFWSCAFTQEFRSNASHTIISQHSTPNRTINVEYPPTVALNGPDDSNISRNRKINLSFTVSSIHGNSNIFPFPTRIWTNESGEWSPVTGTFTSLNNTLRSQDHVFPEKTDIRWGVQVFEANDAAVFNFSINRTIGIDSVTPTISFATLQDTFIVQNGSFIFTPTDDFLGTVVVFNVTGGGFKEQYYENSSATSGTAITVKLVNFSDDRHNISVVINDTANNVFTSGNITIEFDATLPAHSAFANQSIIANCSTVNITWTTSEETNSTLRFDTDIDVTDGTELVDNVTTTAHSVLLRFGDLTEVDHFYNATSCDRAGNCNISTQVTLTTPASVCTGFSQYSVYDEAVSLTEIQNQTGADLVFVWNATNQEFITLVAGLSANADLVVGTLTQFPVVHLFEDTGSVWFRNVTGAAVTNTFYTYNVSSISNWIRIPGSYTFGNLTESFMNISRAVPSTISNETDSGVGGGGSFGPFNITFFAGWNNTAQDYVSHLFNFTDANATVLEPCPVRTLTATCMEVAWVASLFNVSWNGTAVYANWTI